MKLSVSFTADSLVLRLSLAITKHGVFLTWDAFNAIREPAKAGEFYRPERHAVGA